MAVDHFTPNSNNAFFECTRKEQQPQQTIECVSNAPVKGHISAVPLIPISGTLASHNELNTNDLLFGDLNFGGVTDDEESHSINWR